MYAMMELPPIGLLPRILEALIIVVMQIDLLDTTDPTPITLFCLAPEMADLKNSSPTSKMVYFTPVQY